MGSKWKLKKLSDVATFLNHKRIPLNSLEREKRNGIYPYYGASGIVDYIDDFIFDGKYLLISEDGENLRTRKTPIAFQVSGKFWVNNHAHIILEKEEGIQDYLEYYFTNLDLTPHITGAVQPKLNKANLNNIEIPIPNKDERLRINSILNSLSNRINLNDKINQTLENIAQAIFKSWFVDFDPVKAKIAVLENGGTQAEAELAAMRKISAKSDKELAQFKLDSPEEYAQLTHTASLFPSKMQDSELGEIPEGWEVKALDEIAHYQNGLALQKFRPEGDEFLPVVKIAELKKGSTQGSEKASPNIKKECIIDNGDVIFSWSGTLFIDVWCGGKAALNQHLFKVTSENYPKWFYYYFTKHHLASFQQIAADKAVTMGHIKREHLSQAKCVVPNNIKVSTAFIMLENIVNQQILNRLNNFTLSNIKEELLPILLTQRIIG